MVTLLATNNRLVLAASCEDGIIYISGKKIKLYIFPFHLDGLKCDQEKHEVLKLLKTEI